MNNRKIEIFANDIRKDIIIMLTKAGSGHLGGSLGLADIFAVLYSDNNILNVNPINSNSLERDFLFVSNGHVCPVLYSTLANAGFFNKNKLNTLRKLGSKLQGHNHINSISGVENTGGSLGQGISQAIGLAVTLKRDMKKNKVFCIVGDGELEEGQVWEAIMFSAKEKLDNLYIIVDRNNIQIDGNTKSVSHLEPLHRKFTSFNCHTIDFDGNDIPQIKTVFKEAFKLKGKPKVLIAKTTPGKGFSLAENNYKWHGKVPNKEESKIALNELKTEKDLF
jgi:transketolase